jgi:hypothetical protein
MLKCYNMVYSLVGDYEAFCSVPCNLCVAKSLNLPDRNITWPNNHKCPFGIQNLMHDIWITQFYSTKQHWNERGVGGWGCLKYFADDCRVNLTGFRRTGTWNTKSPVIMSSVYVHQIEPSWRYREFKWHFLTTIRFINMRCLDLLMENNMLKLSVSP